MRELITTITFIVLLAVLLFGGMLTLIAAIDYKECEGYSEATGRNTTYKFYGGCFVETKDGWFSYKELKKEIE